MENGDDQILPTISVALVVKFVSVCINFGVVLLLTNGLGVSDYGEYEYIFSCVVVTSIFSG